MIAGLVAMPLIVRWLGTDRYGLYVLMILLISYSASADLGMSTAAVRFASKFHEQGEHDLERDATWTAAWLAALSSGLLVALIEFDSASLVKWARVSLPLREDAIVALRVIAVAVFFTNIGGVFFAPQLSRLRYALNSSLLNGSTILRHVFVCAALLISISVTSAAVAITVAAACIAALSVVIALRIAPQLRFPSFNRALAGDMIRFGAGVVVTTLIAAVVAHGEKLLLARFAALSDLAYYAIAFSVAGTLLAVPTAVSQAVMPVFARQRSGHAADAQVYDRLIRATLLFLMPAAAVLSIGVRPFLQFWLDADFANHGVLACRILLIGFLAQGLAEIPYQAVVGAGRTDLCAKIAFAELPPYVALLFVLVPRFGIVGAATGWTIRALADMAVMFVVVRRLTGWSLELWKNRKAALVAAVVCVLAPVALYETTRGNDWTKATMAVISLFLYALIVWFGVLPRHERDWLRRLIRLSPRVQDEV